MDFTQAEEDIIQEHTRKEEERIRNGIQDSYTTYSEYKEEARLILGNWDIFVELCHPPIWLPPEFDSVLYSKSCYTESVPDILGFIDSFICHEMYDDGYPNIIYFKKSKELPPLKGLSVEEAGTALRDWRDAKYMSSKLDDATDALIIRHDEIDADHLNLLENKILVSYDSLLDAINFKKKKNNEYEIIRMKRCNMNASPYQPQIASNMDKTLKKLLLSFENNQK